MTLWSGTCSWFGGPDDDGVAPDEGLAFIYEIDDAPHLFLPQAPPGTTGLARRLNPDRFYIACRWDYDVTSKEELLNMRVLVHAPKTGKRFIAKPADWGPHEEKTGRVADLSPGLMAALGIDTDDEVEVTFPLLPRPKRSPKPTVVISAGHGDKVRGASGVLDEVDEAQRVVPRLAKFLRAMRCIVYEFVDHESTTQDENLAAIVDYHNTIDRDLDISVHFNASDGGNTSDPIGTEVLYVTQLDLADDVAMAIADAGDLIDRGPKQRTNLYWLNNTTAPAVLLEICFCNSSADAAAYNARFDAICEAIADAVMAHLSDEG
jgi:N-acetylmuramoyl-L-alanine amidase